jgi:seryl-tRNA synthetase
MLAADAESSGGFFTNPMLWRVINLSVFVLILIYVLRNKIGIGKVFDDRAAAITRELEEARKEKQEAQQRIAEVEARLSRLDQEISEISREAEREAAREAEIERIPTAVPVGNGDSYNIPAAASAQPRTNPAFEVRRGPQNELEDLDIPAFLRRNR